MRILLAAAGGLLIAQPVLAQTYPERPVTIVVPFPAGSGIDSAVRLIGDELSSILGQPIVVMNSAGGSGILGFQALQDAAPDGYTLSVFHNGLSVVRRIADPNFNGDPEVHYTPVAMAYEGIEYIAAHPDAPFEDAQGFVDYVRENPGALPVAMAGVGSSNHISALNLMQEIGSEFNLISYTGSTNAMRAAVSGEVAAVIVSIPLDQQVELGQLTPIAIGNSAQAALDPTWPLLDDAGVDNTRGLINWVGFFAPVGTPPEIVETLSQAIDEAFEDQLLQDRVHALAGTYVYATPQEITDRILREIEDVRDLVVELDLTF